MGRTIRRLVGVIGGIVPAVVEAQQASPAGSAKSDAATTQSSPAAQPAGSPTPGQNSPAPVQFRGADGKPLPPEIQRKLEEQLRNNPSALLGNGSAQQQRGTGNDILVTTRRARGAVIGDVPPERTFGPLDAARSARTISVRCSISSGPSWPVRVGAKMAARSSC